MCTRGVGEALLRMAGKAKDDTWGARDLEVVKMVPEAFATLVSRTGCSI
jgi:hypothetical protein